MTWTFKDLKFPDPQQMMILICSITHEPGQNKMMNILCHLIQ